MCLGQRVRPTASVGRASGGPAGSTGAAGTGGRRPCGKAGEDPPGALAAALGAGSLVITFAQSTAKLKPVTAAQTLIFIYWHPDHHPSPLHLITYFNKRSHGCDRLSSRASASDGHQRPCRQGKAAVMITGWRTRLPPWIPHQVRDDRAEKVARGDGARGLCGNDWPRDSAK
jgi:hypothetical protein